MTFRRFIFTLLLFANLCFAETFAPEFSGWMYPPSWVPRREIARTKLGLALSGGGIRGLAHIGVLQALNQAGIEVDYIAGVSMGSVVGALYASGYSPSSLSNLILNIDWGELFTDEPSRRSLFLTRKRSYGRHILQVRFKNWRPYIPVGITSGQSIYMLFDDFLMNAVYRPEPDFDNLKVPFRAPATDLFTGELVIFNEGDLSEALSASIAFPLVFSPIKVRGRTLVDGGALENIPVSTVRAMGADKIIAVDTSSPLLQNVDEPWEIANQITTIMIADKMEQALSEADLALKPLPDSVGSFDFSFADSIPKWAKVYTESFIDTITEMLDNHLEPDTITLAFNYISFLFQGELEIEAEDTLFAQNDEPLTRSGLLDFLAHLYEKYQLADVQAKLSGDSLQITLTAAPIYRHIVIEGSELLPDSLIIKAIHSPPGMPLNYSTGVNDREKIIQLYRDRGFALAAIEEAALAGDTLRIKINEGRIVKLTVREGRLGALNDLGIKTGEIFNWNKARRGLNRLYGTDIYETVRLTADKQSEGYELILILDRRSFPLIRLGARYDLERKSKWKAEFIHEDILGSGTSVVFSASPGKKDDKFGFEIFADRILGTYVSFNTGIFYQDLKYPLYDSRHNRYLDYRYERTWGIIRVGQHIARWGMLSAALKMERSLSDHPDDNPDLRSGALIFESAIDTYDRYPFPRSGEALRLTFQTAGEIVPGDVTYAKFSSHFQRWIQLRNRWCLNLRLRGGYAEPTIPTWEKFSLGGLNDFGGLYEREVLGNQLFKGSIGVRFDLLSRFLAEAFISARYDFGQIVDGTDALQFEKGFFRQGVSLSFALNTFIGPIEFAYGWAAPYKEIPQNHILYFSAGHEF